MLWASSADCPEKTFAVRKDSPLIVGVGRGENFIASDIPAILSKTRDIYRLKDQEIAVLTRDSIEFWNSDRKGLRSSQSTLNGIFLQRKRAATSTL